MEKSTKEIIESLRQSLLESRKKEAHWFDKLKPWQRYVVYALMVPGVIVAVIVCSILSHLFVWLIQNQ